MIHRHASLKTYLLAVVRKQQLFLITTATVAVLNSSQKAMTLSAFPLNCFYAHYRHDTRAACVCVCVLH